jgi:hypothetical protein
MSRTRISDVPTTKRRADFLSTSVPVRHSRLATLARPLAALTIAALLVDCKPADEPPRRAPAAASTSAPDVAAAPAADGGSSLASLGTIRISAPDGGGPAPAPEIPLPDAETAAAPDAAEADAPSRLSAEVLAVLAQPPTADAEAIARKLNAKGLAFHRRLEVPAAIREYREALQAWPAHVPTNYNMACALALQGDSGGALHHLEVLGALSDPTARRKLDSARTDPDLAALEGDSDFRRLTGWLPVQVTAAPELTDATSIGATVALLRKAFVPARDGGQWSKSVDGSTLFVRVDDPAAASMADSIMAALSPPPKRVDSRFLGEDKPLVLVLAATDAAAAAAATLTRPEDAIDTRLTASVEGGVERLYLKKTGFFSWERVEDSGRRTDRTGRYQLDNGALAIDYRQVVETPREGEAPDVQVDQGRRSTHKAVVEDGALVVDGVAFRP